MLKPNEIVKVERRLVDAAVRALAAHLADVDFVKLQLQTETSRAFDADAVLRMRIGRESRALILQVKSSGEPQAIRAAVQQLARATATMPRAYGIVCAPFLSSRSTEICRENKVGYVDLVGNCLLAFDHVYIRGKNDGARSPIPRRTLRSLFAPKAARVLRAMIEQPRRNWKLVELAEVAGVSIGQTSNVKQLLERRELIKIAATGISLSDPRALLEEWTDFEKTKKTTVHAFYSPEPVRALERTIADVNDQDRCVLTEFSAASFLSRTPIRYSRTTAYVRGDVDEVARRFGLKRVDSGSNVHLFDVRDEGVLFGTRTVEGVETVSPLQCYFDLLRVRGRGSEAAESVLAAIQESW